MPHSVVYI